MLQNETGTNEFLGYRKFPEPGKEREVAALIRYDLPHLIGYGAAAPATAAPLASVTVPVNSPNVCVGRTERVKKRRSVDRNVLIMCLNSIFQDSLVSWDRLSDILHP